MLNELGIYLRKLRLDNNEIMKDMAKKLSVSTSFLSAVENSKKNIPEKWEEEISSIYRLNDTQREDLKKSILYSTDKIIINLKDLSDEKKELVFLFKNNLKYMNDEDEQKLLNILKRKRR